MRRKLHHDYQDHRHYEPPEHMDTQAFAQAYGARGESSDRYYGPTRASPPPPSRYPPAGGAEFRGTLPPEDPYYRQSYQDNYMPPPHSSQVSNVWKTLERHKTFLKSDPMFEKSVHDQINAIAESRMNHEQHLKDLDERLTHYSSILGIPMRKSGSHPQIPPGARDLGAKRTPTGLMVFFKTRPLGFEVDFREAPFRVTRVWRPELTYIGVTAEMTIDQFDGYRPTKEAIEEQAPPFIIHFSTPAKSFTRFESPPLSYVKEPKPSKTVSFRMQAKEPERPSPVEKLEQPDDDEKTEENLKTPEPVTQTVSLTTPDREEPPQETDISASVDAVLLHPKLNLEKFTTRELGKLYGRAYGRYLEQQVLPWSKETDTEKERLKILMGRVRVLLEKYSVVLESEIQQTKDEVGDVSKLVDTIPEPKPITAKVEEIDREREQIESVAQEDTAKESESSPTEAEEEEESKTVTKESEEAI